MGLDRPRVQDRTGEKGDFQASPRTGLPDLSKIASPSRSRADRQVGDALERLQDRGFLVILDIEQGDGSVEHLVSGPSGVFLIEARRRCGRANLMELRERAEELRAELETWVAPVICLTGPFARGPRRLEKVWIVGRRRIVSWIERRRNPVLEGRRLLRDSELL